MDQKNTTRGNLGKTLRIRNATVALLLPRSCKNWLKTTSTFFEKFVESNGKFMMPLFRWKFERVHITNKIQKPYAATSKAITLAPNKPVRVFRE
jgi:hypothetical protein